MNAQQTVVFRFIDRSIGIMRGYCGYRIDECFIADVLKVAVDTSTHEYFLIGYVCWVHEVIRRFREAIIEMRSLQLLRGLEYCLWWLVFWLNAVLLASGMNQVEFWFLHVIADDFTLVVGFAEQEDSWIGY